MRTKNLSYLLCILIITACVPQQTTTAPQATVTLPSTNTPVPTATTTPTQTPDPLIGSPEGTTGKNSKGEWIKTVAENGKEVVYVHREITPSDKNNPLYSGWFRLLTPKPIPADDEMKTYVMQGSSWVDSRNTMPITVYVAEGVPGAETIQSLTHVDLLWSNSKNIQWSRKCLECNLFYKRFLGKNMRQTTDEEYQKLRSELQDEKAGTAVLTFTVSGKEYSWEPSPNVGATVYIMNWEDTEPTKENGFIEWKDFTNTDYYRSAFWGVDANGHLLGAITSQKPLTELSQTQIRWMVLYHTVSVLDSNDLTDFGFGSESYFWAGVAGEDSPPYIIINP